MNPDNFKYLLGNLYKRKPFLPFTLELLNGTKLEIHHPEALTAHERLVSFTSNRGVRSVFEYVIIMRIIDATGVG